MVVEVKCSNGHLLKVKDEFAGKRGRCPYCKTEVRVPAISEDDILDIVGPAVATACDADESIHHDEPQHDSPAQERSSSIIRSFKVCPGCGERVIAWFAFCPHCSIYFRD